MLLSLTLKYLYPIPAKSQAKRPLLFDFPAKESFTINCNTIQNIESLSLKYVTRYIGHRFRNVFGNSQYEYVNPSCVGHNFSFATQKSSLYQQLLQFWNLTRTSTQVPFSHPNWIVYQSIYNTSN